MTQTAKIRLTVLQSAMMLTLAFGLVSCNREKAKDPKEVAEEHNDAKFENNKSEKDAQFMVNAAEISMEEISLGMLAQQKGTASHVRDLGKMMETEHTASLDQLTALAKAKAVSLPADQTRDGQDAYEKLSKKTGKEFDQEYADMMVKGHKDAIEKFENAAKESTDPEIAAWASSTLPTLRTHLDHAIACQKKCEEEMK